MYTHANISIDYKHVSNSTGGGGGRGGCYSVYWRTIPNNPLDVRVPKPLSIDQTYKL